MIDFLLYNEPQFDISSSNFDDVNLAMVVSAEFRVEKKYFWIEKLGERWKVCEKVKGFVVKIEISRESMLWLRQKSSLLTKGANKIGFFSSIRSKSEDLVMTIKENKGGRFVSIVCIDQESRRRPKAIYCPQGRDGVGWKTLFKAIDECVGQQARVVALPKKNGTVPVNGPDLLGKKFDVGKVDLERISEMRDKGVLIESKSGTVSWSNVIEDIKLRLNVTENDFELFILSKKKALCEFNTKEIALSLLYVSDWCVENVELSAFHWFIGADTLSPNTLLNALRWVKCEGIPFHLWTRENVEKLCKQFGIFRRIDEERSKCEESTCLMVLVDNCNLCMMPQVAVLVEAGVSYPVKLSPVLEVIPVEASTDSGDSSSSHDLSYAEVAKLGHQRGETNRIVGSTGSATRAQGVNWQYRPVVSNSNLPQRVESTTVRINESNCLTCV